MNPDSVTFGLRIASGISLFTMLGYLVISVAFQHPLEPAMPFLMLTLACTGAITAVERLQTRIAELEARLAAATGPEGSAGA